MNDNKIKWYTIFQTTPAGAKCIFDGKTTFNNARNMCEAWAAQLSGTFELFQGKNVGQKIAEWKGRP